MRNRSKRYKQSEKQLDLTKTYQLKEAILILKKMAQPKFDGSVDLHFNLNVDPKSQSRWCAAQLCFHTEQVKRCG